MRASKQEKSIVERSIKEMRRHLRKINFNTRLLDNKSTDTLLVQRVLYAYVKKALGVSPHAHKHTKLFGNSIHDRGILLPHVPNRKASLYELMTKMFHTQANIIKSSL